MSTKSKAPPPGSGRLFSDARSSAATSDVHVANVDGASRGNPGPAAYAVVMRNPAGQVVLELGKRIGRETNNVAEYYALLAALDYATVHGIRFLRIRSDSELLVRQVQGRYKVKSAHLRPLHERVHKLARELDYFAIEHVPREMNREADALANAALDSGSQAASTRAPSSPVEAGLPDEARRGGAQAGVPAQAKLHHLRARFVNGVFVPLESPGLPENAEVLLDVRSTKS